MNKNQEISQTILAQLGGNKFIAMTGAKQFGYSSEGLAYLSFKIGRNSSRCNCVKIVYNEGRDEYEMYFYYASVKGLKELNKFEGVHFDQLRSIFTEVTGMYTSLAG